MLKIISLTVFISVVSGCGEISLTVPLVNSKSQNCTVSEVNGASTITCPDGTTTTVSNGIAGQAGTAGQNGSQGLGAGLQATQLPNACNGVGGVQLITFTDPSNSGFYNATSDTVTSTTLVCNGAVGQQGLQGNVGATGSSGQNGTSSSVSVTVATSAQCSTGGQVVVVTNAGVVSTPKVICNGLVGATGSQGSVGPQGPAGNSGLTPMSFIAPCGLASSAWKEELILFSNGDLLADFSQTMAGQDTRLSFIPDGSYQDTDESGCKFSINTNTTTHTRTLSWQAGCSSAEPHGWAAGSTSWSVPASFNPSVGE
jgi:hypothetical protein